MTLVTVALPIHQAVHTLERAFRSIINQTHRTLEILLVLNGADEGTSSLAQRLASEDARTRVIVLPQANLAAALNVALREARGELVARMDADDACPPDRLARQVAAMATRPHLVALGTAFEVIDSATGRVIATMRPPVDAGALRWKLLLHNVLCHGSMMLRRAAVLAAGGYDESRHRAQDYELWLRLAGLRPGSPGITPGTSIACLPDVLYHYHTSTRGSYSSSSMQASVAAELLVEAWGSLPRGDNAELATLLGHAMGSTDGSAATIDSLEALLNTTPTSASLMAWLWSTWFFPSLPARAIEACRRSRLREVGALLRARGVTEIVVWGAGTHTAWLMEHQPELGLTISGIVDDVLAGQERLGHLVRALGSVRDDDVVVLSSDWHEDALWQKSSTLRERGVKVVRLYGQ